MSAIMIILQNKILFKDKLRHLSEVFYEIIIKLTPHIY